MIGSRRGYLGRELFRCGGSFEVLYSAAMAFFLTNPQVIIIFPGHI